MIGQIELKQLGKKPSVQTKKPIVSRHKTKQHSTIHNIIAQECLWSYNEIMWPPEKLYGKNFHPRRGHMTSMNAGSKQKELINCLYYKYK